MKFCVRHAVVGLAMGIGLILAPTAFADMTAVAPDDSVETPLFTMAELGLGEPEPVADIQPDAGVFDAAFTDAPIVEAPVIPEVPEATLFEDEIPGAVPPVDTAPFTSKLEGSATFDSLVGTVHVEEPMAPPSQPFAGDMPTDAFETFAEVTNDNLLGLLQQVEEPVLGAMTVQDTGLLFRVDHVDDYRSVEMVPAPAGAVLGLMGLALSGWIRRRG